MWSTFTHCVGALPYASAISISLMLPHRNEPLSPAPCSRRHCALEGHLMELTSIPHEPRGEEAVAIAAVLPDDCICRTCGTWACSDCGVLSPLRNRYSERPQHCRTCKSPDGEMLPTRHRARREFDHFVGFLRMSIDGDEPRYPLDAPIPGAAAALIQRLRASAAAER